MAVFNLGKYLRLYSIMRGFKDSLTTFVVEIHEINKISNLDKFSMKQK